MDVRATLQRRERRKGEGSENGGKCREGREKTSGNMFLVTALTTNNQTKMH